MNRFKETFADFRRALQNLRLWHELALTNLDSVFRRTVLGSFWIVLSFLIFLAIKVIVFGSLSGRDTGWFLAYVALGLSVWQVILRGVTDGVSAFISARGWIWSTTLPKSGFSLEKILRNLYSHWPVLLIGVGISLWQTGTLPAVSWMSAVALVLVLVNSFFVALHIGVLASLARDLIHVVQNMMRALFFLTPIFWLPERAGKWAAIIITWNPFHHFLRLYREPLLDGTIPWDSFNFVVAVTLINILAGVAVFSLLRDRIAYWV